MKIEVGKIGKVVLDHKWMKNQNAAKDTFVGVCVGVVIRYNRVPSTDTEKEEKRYTFVTKNNVEKNFFESDVVSFSSVRLAEDVRKVFVDIAKTYANIGIAEEELKKQQNNLKELRTSLEKQKKTLLGVQGIMTPNEFLDAIDKEFHISDMNWRFGFEPGSCFPYDASKLTLYIYREVQVLHKYEGERSSLVYKEYDGNCFMVDNYETMPEFKKYEKQYDFSLFPKLKTTKICFVGDSNSLYFSRTQMLPLASDVLTKELLEKTISMLLKGE